MSVISISNLTFAHAGDKTLFENVSLHLSTTWKLGLIGRNGRGKTTFLKLLTGHYEHSGTISSKVKFDYFPIEISDENMTSYQIAENYCQNKEIWRLEKEASLLQIHEQKLTQPFKTLSGGEKTKIMLACLFAKQSDFLLIDEPTNHLDNDARKSITLYLSKKSGFILVSHDRVMLDACTDHSLILNKTGVELQKGSFSSWLANKQLQDKFETEQNEKLKKEVKRLKNAAQEKATWADKKDNSKNGLLISGIKADKGYIGHIASKMMKRAKSIEKRFENAVEEKSKLLKNIETDEEIFLKPLPLPNGINISLDNISLFYDDYQVCSNISFNLSKSERIALDGKNGCGKSTLLKLITGEKIKHAGNIFILGGLKISYVPQDTDFLKGSLKNFAYDAQIEESLLKSFLKKLGFERSDFEKDISLLSSGEKKKITIAKSLCEKPHIYLWDEPLNFIDPISRNQIENAILKSCPTMIFIEHDEVFRNKIATRKLFISP